MTQSVFGVGYLFSTPTGANPTPTRFARLQDVAVDWEFELKTLYGSSQFPVENARGKGKIAIKATSGAIDPFLFNNIFFGQTLNSGETLNSVDEGPTAIPGTPYVITVANGSTFSQDLGVYNATSKLWMTRVASSPATGQYSVNTSTGVYTFAAADTTNSVRISYTYASSSTGKKLAYTNQLMGTTVIFSMQLVNRFTGGDGISRSLFLNFPSCQAIKLSMPMKLDDFSLPSFDIAVQDDGSGNIFNYSMTG
jgi:hypothetical protein